jgi:hypothetical protein
MLCTAGHNNADNAAFCRVCGVNTFSAPSIVVKQSSSSEFHGMAIASMVMGIVWLYGVGSILALVFGYMAKREIARTGPRGIGMSTAGIVLGWVGPAGVVFIIFFVTAIFHSVHFTPCTQLPTVNSTPVPIPSLFRRSSNLTRRDRRRHNFRTIAT